MRQAAIQDEWSRWLAKPIWQTTINSIHLILCKWQTTSRETSLNREPWQMMRICTFYPSGQTYLQVYLLFPEWWLIRTDVFCMHHLQRPWTTIHEITPAPHQTRVPLSTTQWRLKSHYLVTNYLCIFGIYFIRYLYFCSTTILWIHPVSLSDSICNTWWYMSEVIIVTKSSLDNLLAAFKEYCVYKNIIFLGNFHQ